MEMPPPLMVVTVLLRERHELSALAHVSRSISAFLDGSVEIPLPHACTLGSLDLLDRIWESSDPRLPSVASPERWSLCNFLRADRHYNRAQFSKAMEEAVGRGDLAVVRWLFEHLTGGVVSNSAVTEAAGAGHFHILQFFLERGRHEQDRGDPGGNEYRNMVIWGGKDMAEAAKRGHDGIVRWLYEHTPNTDRSLHRVIKYAVRKGNIPLVQWLLANVYRDFPQLPPPELNDAARGGHLDMLQWLFDQGYVENVDRAFHESAMQGYMEVVQWLVLHGFQENVEEAVWGAAASGKLSIVRWLLDRNIGRSAPRAMYLASINGHAEVAQFVHEQGLTEFGEHMMMMAAERGHLEVVQWLCREFSADPNVDLFPVTRMNRDGYPRHATVMDAAASAGQLVVLQYLHRVSIEMDSTPERKKRKRAAIRGESAHRVPTCTRAAMTNAAAQGHLEVVQWLHRNRSEGCSPTAINAAARNGHLEMVQWLHEHTLVGCTTAAMDGAAANGHLKVVQWLHENRSEGCTTMAMDRAASKGHLSVVQWLHANRFEGCTSFAMDSASRSGHLGIVKWLHTNRTEGCTESAMDGAAYNGHFDVVQWLHRHRQEGCTVDAMHFAAVHGHFEILLFLQSQRNEGCSAYAVFDAAGRGHTEIVGWLREHYPNI